jgi:hypothetical protein
MIRKQPTPAKLGLAVAVAVAAAAGLGSWASAGLIPGGQTKSDCLVELNVEGIDNPGPNVSVGRFVTCTDGDPCDTDGMCGNNSCTFRVAVCVNQDDPNLPTCHPPTRLQKPPHVSSRLAGAVPSTFEGSACGPFVDVAVPSNKKRGMLRLSANATAPKGTKPRRDRDTFILKCLPRATPCAPTTSTTTTTTTTLAGAGGSTTTTIQGISMGCTFQHGQCTGSCAPGSRCGSAVGTGSCECRSVSCGAANAPQCAGACASASDTCIFDPLNDSCHCVSSLF